MNQRSDEQQRAAYARDGQFDFNIDCPNETAEAVGDKATCTAEIPGNPDLRLPGASTDFEVEFTGDDGFEWEGAKVRSLGLRVGP